MTYIKIPKKYEKMECSNMRKVIMTILEKDLKQFKNKKILEIGCGNWDFCKKILEKQGCQWFGLDVIKTDIANILGTVDKIPFPDKTFDLVLCNQCFEHIYEYGISFDKALREINRVLKPGSYIMINAPVYYHGHPWFLLNKWKLELFGNKYFIMKPPARYFNEQKKGWRQLSDKGFFSHIGYPDFLFPKDAFSHQIFYKGFKGVVWKDVTTKLKKDYLRIPKMMIRFIVELIKG